MRTALPRTFPDLLRQLSVLPPADEARAEPYFSLWSALCHQGNAYVASYAAVPHIVAAIRREASRAPWTLLSLVASIEISRQTGRGPVLPEGLRPSYEEAIQGLPALVASVAGIPWDRSYCQVALAAIAVAKGHINLGETILELDDSTMRDLLAAVRGGAA